MIKAMTHRERVLTAMRRQQPDRVPYMLDYQSFAPDLMEVFKKETGADNPDEYFDYDVRILRFRPTNRRTGLEKYIPDVLPKGAHINWELGNIDVTGAHKNINQTIRHALQDAENEEDIENYPMPDFLEPYRWKHLDDDVQALHSRGYAALGYMSQTLFETAWKIRGFENFLVDLATGDGMASLLLNRLCEIRQEQARIYARADVDIIRLGDDVGTEHGMLISPLAFRGILKPMYRSIIEAAREIKPDVLFWFHSDGDCGKIIPDLIDIGIDILNPVQPECMDPARIKLQYGDSLSFAGTIGTQYTMSFGTAEQVRNEVKLRIETVGKGGGLLLCPSHLLQDEVPWSNVVAFFDADSQYGRYT